MNNNNNTNRHHLFFPRPEWRKHTIPNLVREHPVNIHRTEVWRHNQLHARTIGGLAVMSGTLAREVLEFLGDLPDVFDDRNKLKYLQREQYYLDRLTHRQGMLGKEATYFARALEYQIPYITPLET